MTDVWTRLVNWLDANAPEVFATLESGALPEELHELEQTLGQTLPEDFRASYAIFNGQGLDEYGDLPALVFGGSLCPLSAIEVHWLANMEHVEPGWIPFTTCGYRILHVLDLDADGRVLELRPRSKAKVVAPTFRSFLTQLAETLEAGEHVYCEAAGSVVPRKRAAFTAA